jgi:uncharacterized protein (DUF697 family)
MQMRSYEERVGAELREWEREMLKPPSLFARQSKKVQTKINEMIPEKVHAAITAAVKGIVKSVLFGLEYVPKGLPIAGMSLEERDARADELLSTYKKIAAAEGAGTGAVGFVAGLVDFPALIAIKMKFLFELAHVYGYDTREYRERLYLLYVFQLCFSGPEKRAKLFHDVENWEQTAGRWPSQEQTLQEIDWEQFQREYRDSIDLRKLLQMVPGIGAVVGAWANYGLVDDLGEVGKNCFRQRLLDKKSTSPL